MATKIMNFRIVNTVFGICILMAACYARKDAVEAAMHRYDQLILKVDADAIADCFLENGMMGEKSQMKIVGKDSIRKFLKSFSHIKVVSNKSTVIETRLAGDSAVLKCRFNQVAILNQDTLHASGNLYCTWVEVADHHWKLRSLFTESNPQKSH